jgi:hypothetical protein
MKQLYKKKGAKNKGCNILTTDTLNELANTCNEKNVNT